MKKKIQLKNDTLVDLAWFWNLVKNIKPIIHYNGLKMGGGGFLNALYKPIFEKKNTKANRLTTDK